MYRSETMYRPIATVPIGFSAFMNVISQVAITAHSILISSKSGIDLRAVRSGGVSGLGVSSSKFDTRPSVWYRNTDLDLPARAGSYFISTTRKDLSLIPFQCRVRQLG